MPQSRKAFPFVFLHLRGTPQLNHNCSLLGIIISIIPPQETINVSICSKWHIFPVAAWIIHFRTNGGLTDNLWKLQSLEPQLHFVSVPYVYLLYNPIEYIYTNCIIQTLKICDFSNTAQWTLNYLKWQARRLASSTAHRLYVAHVVNISKNYMLKHRKKNLHRLSSSLYVVCQ